MAQNVYDDPEFFDGYAQLARSQQGLAAAKEWDAVRAVVGNVAGLDVLDLGCGYGWFSRWARDNGARRVVGLDVSARMLARAREFGEGRTDIEYRRQDLASAPLGNDEWDLVHSSLALHYLPDLDDVARRVAAGLRAGGRFVFSTEHPVFSARARGGWVRTDDGDLAWQIRSYMIEGRRVTDWIGEGVVKYHRTIGTQLTALLRAGLRIEHVQEWSPTAEQIHADPELANEQHRAQILIVAASRPTPD